MNAFRKQGSPRDALWHKIKELLAKKVLDRELSIVQAIVDTRRESNSEINVEFEKYLLRTDFMDFLLLTWAAELEINTEMRQFLIDAVFTTEGTSKISEETAPFISLVIDDRKWAFEDVKCLIRKGHDVNKCDQNSSDFARWGQLPFHVALRSYRYDIAKLLLLNGAQYLPTNTLRFSYVIHEYFRVGTLYLLITCNSLLSVAVGGETILRHILKSTHRYFP